MTGNDLGSYAAGEIAKLIGFVLLLACIPMALGVWGGYYYGKKSVPVTSQTEADIQKTITYTDGYRAGALAVANWDRVAEGLVPYKDWKEFDKVLQHEHEINQGALQILKEELNRRAEQQNRDKQFPRPWMKK